jgi:hypothetical protein
LDALAILKQLTHKKILLIIAGGYDTRVRENVEYLEVSYFLKKKIYLMSNKDTLYYL